MQRKILLFAFILLALSSFAQNVMKLQPGSSIKTTGGVVITLHDMNLDNEGTINQAAGEGSFRFTGSAHNFISGTSTPVFDILEIAKPGDSKLSLQREITIGSSLQFTSGLIDLNNNNILLQPNSSLIGESGNSRIIGPNGGYVEIIQNLNNPLSVDPGNLGAVITSSQDLGSTTIRRGHIVQTNAGGLSTSIQRYFDIIPTNNASLNATLRFRYFEEELNGVDENTLVMWKSIDNAVWNNIGHNNKDVAENFVEKSGLSDFARFTLSTAFNAPLPVQFLLFNVKCEGSRVNITWKTAQEIKASHFEVQRSSNGADWITIGTVQAAGNSSTPQSYSFTDNSPIANGGMYRIAEIDWDGKKQFTGINRADCGNVETWKAWPNPVDQQLFLSISVTTGSSVMIRIFDSRGALLKEQLNSLMPGNNQLSVDMQRLPAGTYHVVTTWGNRQWQKSVKIIKH